MDVRKMSVVVIAMVAMMVVLSSTYAAYAQTVTIPPRVELLQREEFRQEPGWMPSIPEVRIWGWSQDNRVAYSIERGGTYNGDLLTVQFVILNLVNDRAVFELEMISEDFSGDCYAHPEYGDECNLDTIPFRLYRENMSAIRQALTRHNIVRRQADFSRFPIERDGAVYNITFRFTDTKDGDDAIDHNALINGIRSYGVIANRNNQRKTIANFNDRFVSSVGAAGYFLSPFDNNRAFVVIYEFQRYIREEASVFFKFAGCHLETGFR